jgi:mono/diheme cytochrome c family protein
MHKPRIAAAIMALVFPMLAAAQNKPTVKRVPVQTNSVVSGKEMFQTYCSPCHGKSGKGDGPAGPAMRVPPPDLTKLAAKNNGVFPEAEVAEALREGPTATPTTSAHGSQTMPVWGPVFRSMSPQTAGLTNLRIHNLVEYVRSIQEK